MTEADSETEEYYVGFKVCDGLGYEQDADVQLAQIKRYRGRVSVGALEFARDLSAVAFRLHAAAKT